MRINIFTKVLLIFFAFVIAISSALFFALRHQTRLALKSQIIERLGFKSSSVLSSIDRFMYERLNDLKSLRENPIMSSKEICRENFKDYDQYFRKELAINGFYESFTLFDTNRTRIYDSDYSKIGQQHDLSIYWLDLENQEFAVDISKSKSRQKMVIHFAYKVYNKNGVFSGVIVARVLATKIKEIFDDLINYSEMGRNLTIKLVNKEGNILYDRNNINAELVSSINPHTFFNENYEIIHDGKISQKLYHSKDSLYILCREKGYQTYKGSQWSLIIGVAEEEVFLPLKELERIWKITLLILMVISAIVAALVAKSFTKSINLIKHAAFLYGKGNFDLKLNIKTKDEREDLAVSLTKMAKQLEARIEFEKNHNIRLTKENQKLTLTSDELKFENENHNSSLKYASLIQKSLLPNLESFKYTNLNISIINQPLKLIGGDFYYFHDFGDGKLIFISIDCTGHGVPGAILTIIAHNMIKEIVETSQIFEPNLILDNIHESLLNGTLKKGEFTLNEGMDVSIVLIDKIQNTLKYAGTFGSLIYLTQDSVNQIKGERIPLGSNFEKHKNHRYGIVSLDIREIRSFYLYTDGIVDQLGFLDGKKFTVSRLRETIFITRDLDLEEQMNVIEKSIHTWKGKEQQTDDMLLIAIDISNLK